MAEHPVLDGQFNIDIALLGYKPPDGKGAAVDVAIEVDGPIHFATNDRSKVLGSTAVRNRWVARGAAVLWLTGTHKQVCT